MKVYDRKKIARGLLVYVRDKHSYRDIHLSRASVADYLNVPPKILSEVLRDEMNTNFNDFVNLYRVRYVNHLLSNPSTAGKTLDDISIMSGFSCRMTMHRAYLKVYGCSPRQLLKL